MLAILVHIEQGILRTGTTIFEELVVAADKTGVPAGIIVEIRLFITGADPDRPDESIS